MTQIAFIGLGNMGPPMAVNLVKAGHKVTGFDLAPDAAKTAAEAGAGFAGSAKGAVAGAGVVILMLPNGQIVEDVVSDVLPAMDKGTLLIDCSTIDVATARRVHAMADAAGVKALDAPVSGGTGGAKAGTLTFMVGGTVAAFDAGKPFFDIMGQKAVHCGDGGAGQAAKICNNMLLGISMIGACEAFKLGDKLGLDRQALFDVVSTSSGSCWSVNTYCPVPGVGPSSPADLDYQPGFSAQLMLKDLGLAIQAADENGASTALGAHARDMYDAMVKTDPDGLDFSGIIHFLSPKAGT